MNPARPLFFVALLAAFASSVVAADKPEKSQTTSLSTSSVANAAIVAEPGLQQPSGLVYSVAKAQAPGQPPVSEPPLAKLDDGICYTLRIYKVKWAERIADGDTADRGYTTCEMASNYQVRSAIAHPRTADDSRSTNPQK